MSIKNIVIPIFIPHKGCPFDCIYCNQKVISGQLEEMTKENMINIIESHISTSDSETNIEIGFFGGSFTGIPKEEQLVFLETANIFIKSGKIKGIKLSTRPDYINSDILKYLKKFNVSTIELGVQSLDEEVLRRSSRGHTIKDVYDSANLIKEFGLILGIQTMIGLPGDTREKDILTAELVVKLVPKIVRIYPTLVVKKTYLEEMYKEGFYKPLELSEAVDICSELLELYKKNNIDVIRVGLQPTDSINEGLDVVAGPFHPSFRQLCEARIGLKLIEESIKEKRLEKEKCIVITSGFKNIDNVVGQKKVNIKTLKEKYGFENIEVKINKQLQKEIIVEKHLRIEL